MLNLTKEEINKKIKKTVSVILMITVYTVSVASVGVLGRKVDINVDSDTISTFTINSDTNKILSQSGITVCKDDIVDRFEELDGTIKLNIKRAFNITVTKGGETVNLKMANGTVRDAVLKSGINMEESNDTNFSFDSALVPGMEITVFKKIKVKINADGESKEFSVPAGRTSDAIEYLGFPLSSEDIINVDIFSDVYEGMEITINRITYKESVKTEEIPFGSNIKRTDLLEAGTRKITCEGKKGQKEVTFKETLMDGSVIKSEEIKSRIISEPADEIILEGTKNSGRTVSPESTAPCRSSNCSNVVTGSATAYTAPAAARTSTGAIPVQGVTIAVNPRIIPYGKKITVRSLDGSFECKGIAQDTGGALRSGSAVVDIYMNSEAECIKFGRKKVKVYFD